MEQSGISIISPPGVTDNSVGKSKGIGITLRSNGSIQNAKEKLKVPWLKNLIQEDMTLWNTIVIALAEVVGTAILVSIGCVGCLGSLGNKPAGLQTALAFGLAVMIAIQCVGHISGAHINPAITIASLILGKTSLPMFGLYLMAQCLGGILGYGLLKAITPSDLQHGGDPSEMATMCMTVIHHDISLVQGIITEILATGILAFFACGVWDARNEKASDSVAIRFGLCVTVLCLVFSPFTGCSLNPARSLAPAIWNGYWVNQWAFWFGPLCGAGFAALLYRCIFLPKTPQVQANVGQDNYTLSGVET